MSKNLPPINSELHGKMSKLLELHVGFAFPGALKQEEENEIYFNFHIMLNGFQWVETIEYRFLYDLNSNIIPFSDEDQLNNFPNLNADQYATIHQMLHVNDFNEPSIKILYSTARTMETWMYTVFCHLHKIDEESRQLCKQLFFRSEEKLVKFDYLWKILKNKELASGHYDGEKQTINRVFKAMGSLFTSGSNPDGRSKMILSERNLEKHTKLQEKKGSSVTPSVASKEEIGHPKRKSIFSRSMGTKSAMDKREVLNSMTVPPKHTALDVAKNTALMKVEVTRGNEALQGVVWYDITLRAMGKRVQAPSTNASKSRSKSSGGSPKTSNAASSPMPSMVYRVSQRFSTFKKLWLQLNEVNQQFLQKAKNTAKKDTDGEVFSSSSSAAPFANFILLIKAPFPALPMKCYLGFKLNESELSQRTRMLDEWFRDVCVNYKNMPAAARLHIRTFLKFDSDRATDAFFRDQLEWGTVDTNQRKAGPMIVLQQHVLGSVPEEIMDEIEAMSVVDAPGTAMPSRNDRLETRTERSSQSRGLGGGGGGYSELQNLIWETASQGGMSKVPIQEAKGTRAVIVRR